MGVVVGVGWVEKRASASFGGGGVQRGHGQGVCASNGELIVCMVINGGRMLR